jgi:hypothetical protein
MKHELSCAIKGLTRGERDNSFTCLHKLLSISLSPFLLLLPYVSFSLKVAAPLCVAIKYREYIEERDVTHASSSPFHRVWS